MDPAVQIVYKKTSLWRLVSNRTFASLAVNDILKNMNQLTPEQSAALHGEPQTEMVDPSSGKVFVLIEKSLYDVQINSANIASIQRGIEDMKAGRGLPAAEARKETVDRLTEAYGK